MWTQLKCLKNWQAVVGLGLLFGLSGAAQAAFYIYQIPGGTRIITDYPLNNKDYKLIRKSTHSQGVGSLVTERRVQTAMLDRSAYDRLITRAAAKHNVDEALVKAVIHAESGFDPLAVSPKGASGLMQLMPRTAEQYGVQDIFDPVENIHGGVKHLKYLLKMFDNNYRLAIAAYNAGETTVKRYRGIPPYRETQTYVHRVMLFKKRYTTSSSLKVKAPDTAKHAVVARGEISTQASLSVDNTKLAQNDL